MKRQYSTREFDLVFERLDVPGFHSAIGNGSTAR
jgi:hypothetical protein